MQTNAIGTASAAKRGRNPQWPWVPIIDLSALQCRGLKTQQVRGKAFATREEAVAYAERVVASRKRALERALADPRQRALREAHGLPREINS